MSSRNQGISTFLGSQGAWRRCTPGPGTTSELPQRGRLMSRQTIAQHSMNHCIRVFLYTFFLCPFFWRVGGCRLELCHFCKLRQEKCRTADELRGLQRNTQCFATQPNIHHSGFCNPTLFLRLRVLQPNTPLRALGCCNPKFLLGLKVLQPNTPFRAVTILLGTRTLGLGVLQPSTPLSALGCCNATLLSGPRA